MKMGMGMNFFKLSFQTCSATDFVSSWSKCYDEGKYSDQDYERNLNKQGLLTPENVQFLLEWKNAKHLPGKKQSIADTVKSKIAKINEFRQLPKVSDEEFDKFWFFISTIVKSGIVWKVFLLHISRPGDYPIVDQHVLRAWSFLTKKTVEEPEKTLENYKKYRLHFLELARQSGKDLRDIDKALMAFGQFLKSQFFPNEQAYKVSS